MGLGHSLEGYAVAVLKNSYEPAALGAHDGIVSVPDDVLDLIRLVELVRVTVRQAVGAVGDWVECLAGMVPRTERYRRIKLRNEGTQNDKKKNFGKINSSK